MLNLQAFHEVIRELTGCDVLKVTEVTNTGRLLDILDRVSRRASSDMIENPIVRSRPNEVGNDIERHVQTALENEERVSVVPMSYGTGYPDIRANFADIYETVFIECKTFGIGNEATSMRSFYLSPGPAIRSKVDCDALYVVISYEMQRSGNTYIPRSYKLVDLYDLPCRLKEEWQSTNRHLYDKCRVLGSAPC